jgi:hypothetical protein
MVNKLLRLIVAMLLKVANQGVIRYMKDKGKSIVDEGNPPQIDLTFAIEHEKTLSIVEF